MFWSTELFKISYEKARSYYRRHPKTITIVKPGEDPNLALPDIAVDDEDSTPRATPIWESLEYAGVVETIPRVLSVEETPDHRMVVRWIIDSGCGRDLVSHQVLEGFLDLIF